eukprot:13574743-Ditylum_brightwellii.AAC.1
MIFKDLLMKHITATKQVDADDGYIGKCTMHIKCPGHLTNPTETLHMQHHIRNHQEMINNRFKFWENLHQMFLHDPNKHADVFHTIVAICQ